MRNYKEFKSDLDSYLYTQEELNIIYGVSKDIPSRKMLRVLDKTIRLADSANTLRLLGYTDMSF